MNHQFEFRGLIICALGILLIGCGSKEEGAPKSLAPDSGGEFTSEKAIPARSPLAPTILPLQSLKNKVDALILFRELGSALGSVQMVRDQAQSVSHIGVTRQTPPLALELALCNEVELRPSATSSVRRIEGASCPIFFEDRLDVLTAREDYGRLSMQTTFQRLSDAFSRVTPTQSFGWKGEMELAMTDDLIKVNTFVEGQMVVDSVSSAFPVKVQKAQLSVGDTHDFVTWYWFLGHQWYEIKVTQRITKNKVIKENLVLNGKELHIPFGVSVPQNLFYTSSEDGKVSEYLKDLMRASILTR